MKMVQQTYDHWDLLVAAKLLSDGHEHAELNGDLCDEDLEIELDGETLLDFLGHGDQAFLRAVRAYIDSSDEFELFSTDCGDPVVVELGADCIGSILNPSVSEDHHYAFESHTISGMSVWGIADQGFIYESRLEMQSAVWSMRREAIDCYIEALATPENLGKIQQSHSKGSRSC